MPFSLSSENVNGDTVKAIRSIVCNVLGGAYCDGKSLTSTVKEGPILYSIFTNMMDTETLQRVGFTVNASSSSHLVYTIRVHFNLLTSKYALIHYQRPCVPSLPGVKETVMCAINLMDVGMTKVDQGMVGGDYDTFDHHSDDE